MDPRWNIALKNVHALFFLVVGDVFQKQNRYDTVGNEYGTDILIISKTIVVD